MTNWLPVVATLSGAVVAGAISLLVTWLSNRHAIQTAKLTLSEDRARWATEKRLEQLRAFYRGVEDLLEATQHLRIQQAWEASEAQDSIKAPKWVLSSADAREGFERALHKMFLESCLLEREIEDQFGKVRAHQRKWLLAKTTGDGVHALTAMEQELVTFRKGVAERYRLAFEERRKGADIAT